MKYVEFCKFCLSHPGKLKTKVERLLHLFLSGIFATIYNSRQWKDTPLSKHIPEIPNSDCVHTFYAFAYHTNIFRIVASFHFWELMTTHAIVSSLLSVSSAVQLFSTNAFSTNAFSANAVSLNVLSTFTAIYSQSIVNTNNFFTYFYQRKQISPEWHRIY